MYILVLQVGMYGKSWGGFNGLQVGSLQPPALQAVISLYSTDDRYHTDIHYEGGCVIGNGMLSWASHMFLINALPPNPACVPEWKTMWKERLDKTCAPWINTWLSEQHRGDYWKPGSVCENYRRLQCPVLLIGGYRGFGSRPVGHLSHPTCLLHARALDILTCMVYACTCVCQFVMYVLL